MGALRAILARFLPQGAILLSILTFASYAAGLLRDRLFARTYGAGTELDAYNAAFVLPELALDVLVASGLTAPFVPVFASLRRDHPGAAPRFAQTVLTLAVMVTAAASLLLFVLAPQTVPIVAKGFEDDPAARALYIDLFRMMLLTPILFGASITLGEILVAERRFLFYALAPILYNVGIAGGTFLLHGSMGIRAAAVGAVAGAALHLAIRVVGILRTSVPIRPRLDLRMPALREFLRLMLPKMASHPIDPIMFAFFTSVATTLAAGSVSAISFARNFQSVPVSIIGASIALAAFPGMSALWAAGDRTGFGREVRRNVVVIGGLSVVAAVALVVVGPIGIRVLLGGGAFDEEDVRTTSTVLAAFALAVPFDSLGHIVARGLYATHNTVLAVLSALAGLAATVLATLALVGQLGVVAIPIGFAVGTALRVALQGVALAWRMRHGPPPRADEPVSKDRPGSPDAKKADEDADDEDLDDDEAAA
jgi:putative peptidoglycan lipid II flippase